MSDYTDLLEMYEALEQRVSRLERTGPGSAGGKIKSFDSREESRPENRDLIAKTLDGQLLPIPAKTIVVATGLSAGVVASTLAHMRKLDMVEMVGNTKTAAYQLRQKDK